MPRKPISRIERSRRRQAIFGTIPTSNLPDSHAVRSPLFREGIPESHFSFAKVRTFTYRDRLNVYKARIRNPIIPFRDERPHLLLRDRAGTPRFSLCYKMHDKVIVIGAIQQIRTRYIKKDGGYEWSAERERESTKRFRADLDGIYPSEFLLSEFLYTARAFMRAGIPIVIEVNSENRSVYAPLLDRFCAKKPVPIGMPPFERHAGIEYYYVSLSRDRVKEIMAD